MGLSAIYHKCRRIRSIAADRRTLLLLLRMALSRYNYPGFRALRRVAGVEVLGETVLLHLRGRSRTLKLTLRPRETGDVASLFENFIELDLDHFGEVPPGMMIDAGAHIGCFSLVFHDHFPSCPIRALEPDPANAAILRQNWALNELPGQVLECALWKERAHLRFEQGVSNAGHLLADAEAHQGVSVQAECLENIIRADTPVGFLKMDIEGAEREVLPRALDLLSAPCVIYAEIHDVAPVRGALQEKWEEAGWTGTLLASYPPHEIWRIQKRS